MVGVVVATVFLGAQETPPQIGTAPYYAAKENVLLLRSAGRMVARLMKVSCFGAAGSCPNIWAAAIPWLEQARQMEPQNRNLSGDLLLVFQRGAMNSTDPKERVHLLRRGLEITSSDSSTASFLLMLAGAELAAGDSGAAEKDAQRLLDLTEKSTANWQPPGAPAGADMRAFIAEQARRLIEQARQKKPAKN